MFGLFSKRYVVPAVPTKKSGRLGVRGKRAMRDMEHPRGAVVKISLMQRIKMRLGLGRPVVQPTTKAFKVKKY